MFKMNSELKRAWDDVLFWSRRCSYKIADHKPEWKENYKQAKQHLEDVKAKLKTEKS